MGNYASESKSVSHSVISDSLWPYGLYPARLFSPWNSPGNTGVDSHSLLQRIFPTQGSNPGLPHYRQITIWAMLQKVTLQFHNPWSQPGWPASMNNTLSWIQELEHRASAWESPLSAPNHWPTFTKALPNIQLIYSTVPALKSLVT